MINICAKPVTAGDLSGGERILVLAPHPDDETLGCGALLAATFATTGAHVICMTDGAGSHPGSLAWPSTRLAELREAELQAAITHLGGTSRDLTLLGEPDGRLNMQFDRFEAIADKITAIADRTRTTRIFMPSADDAHHDHKATAEIARLVAHRLTGVLFSYPIWSRWDGADVRADYALDVTPFRAQKTRALAAHRSQLGQVVDDDPAGFVMPDGFVDMFLSEHELFRQETP